jgi:hypothetical protein
MNEKIKRDTLFISHATPQDNEFSIWLASRLEMLGYKVWIDKQQLLGGETFWQTIQEVIRDNAVKMLFIYSENVKDETGNLKVGIYKEISYAQGIAKDNKIDDFIIPLHIDNSSFNSFIDLTLLNQIEFSQNWFAGFNQLVEKLKKNNIPCNTSENVSSSFSDWYEEQYASNCVIQNNKPELMYTSWWKIKSYPDYFYIYQFKTATEAENTRAKNYAIPISKISNNLITFESDLSMPNILDEKNNLIVENTTIIPINKFQIKINEINNSHTDETFPNVRDKRNYFSSLISNVYSNLFIVHNLYKYQLSGKRIAYYLPIGKNGEEKIRFVYPYSKKKKMKSIHGEFNKCGYWHFAISYRVEIDTIIGVSMKSHIIFTSNGKDPIADSGKQHSYRRTKGSHFFNEQWRDMQLAFIQRLTGAQNRIELIVTRDNQIIEFSPWPEIFWSQVGYDDPKVYMDTDKIEDFHEEIEENTDND